MLILAIAVVPVFLPSVSIFLLIAEGKPPGKNAALHAWVAVATLHPAALAIFLVRTSPAAAHGFDLIT